MYFKGSREERHFWGSRVPHHCFVVHPIDAEQRLQSGIMFLMS